MSYSDRTGLEGAYSSISEPSLGALQWVWDHVVNGAADAAVVVALAAGGGYGLQGRLWPEADEAAMAELADVWGRLVERLGASQEDLSAESNVVAEFYRGSAGMQFQFSNYQLQVDPLDSVGSALSYQTVLRMGAANFAYAKMSIVMEGVLTAIYVLSATIRAMFTLGVSSGEIPVALAAGRLAALGIFRRLLAALGGMSIRGVTSAARQLGTRAGRQAALRSARRGGLRQAAGRLGREAGWEAFEEGFLIHGLASAAAAGRGYGDGLGFADQLVLSMGAGALGGVGNAALMGQNPVGRALLRGQERLRGSNPVRQFVADAVVSGARIGVTSPLSSFAAMGVLNQTPWFAFEGGPGLWDSFVQGFPTGFVMGAVIGGGSVPASALGSRLSPVPVDARTGLLTGPTGWGIDPVSAQRMVFDDMIDAGVLARVPVAAEPAWPTVEQAIEGLRGQVQAEPALATAVAAKAAAMQEVASVEARYHQFLLGEADLTVAEARSVVAGEPGSLDAVQSRLQAQEAALAAAASEDPELARALDRAGVAETLPDRLTALEQARAAAMTRAAAADDRLAAMDGAAHRPVGSGLAQLRAALAEQVRAELVAAQVTRADVHSPAAEELARQVVAATASGVRPEPQPLAEAVAAGIQDRLVGGGVLPSTAESLAGQLAELVQAGVRVTTVHALIDAVVEQLHRRDPQDSFEALGDALGQAWEMASSEPAMPAGALVDAVAAAGIVDDVNSALGHRRLAVRSRRGSVQLAQPAHGVGSGRVGGSHCR